MIKVRQLYQMFHNVIFFMVLFCWGQCLSFHPKLTSEKFFGMFSDYDHHHHPLQGLIGVRYDGVGGCGCWLDALLSLSLSDQKFSVHRK